MGLLRLIVFGAIGLTLLYFAVSWFSRSTRRERLEKEWDAENPDGDRSERDIYVEKGMKEYNASIRPKLILLVYVIPVLAALLLIYLINFY